MRIKTKKDMALPLLRSWSERVNKLAATGTELCTGVEGEIGVGESEQHEVENRWKIKSEEQRGC